MRTYREMTRVILTGKGDDIELSARDLADDTLDDLEGDLRKALRGGECGGLQDEGMNAAVEQVMSVVMENEAIAGARENKPIINTAKAQWDDEFTVRVERHLEVEL